jgi:hypothetical protein
MAIVTVTSSEAAPQTAEDEVAAAHLRYYEVTEIVIKELCVLSSTRKIISGSPR